MFCKLLSHIFTYLITIIVKAIIVCWTLSLTSLNDALLQQLVCSCCHIFFIYMLRYDIYDKIQSSYNSQWFNYLFWVFTNKCMLNVLSTIYWTVKSWDCCCCHQNKVNITVLWLAVYIRWGIITGPLGFYYIAPWTHRKKLIKFSGNVW